MIRPSNRHGNGTGWLRREEYCNILTKYETSVYVKKSYSPPPRRRARYVYSSGNRKKSISNKEVNRRRAALDFGLNGKGRINPRWYGTKKPLLSRCRQLLLNLQCDLGYQIVTVEKFSQPAGSSFPSWKADKYFNLQEDSREIKLKSNESCQLKFYEVKKGTKIQPVNYPENKFTEHSTEIQLKPKIHN